MVRSRVTLRGVSNHEATETSNYSSSFETRAKARSSGCGVGFRVCKDRPYFPIPALMRGKTFSAIRIIDCRPSSRSFQSLPA